MVLKEKISIIGKFITIKKRGKKYVMYLDLRGEKLAIEVGEEFVVTCPDIKEGEIIEASTSLKVRDNKLYLELSYVMLLQPTSE